MNTYSQQSHLPQPTMPHDIHHQLAPLGPANYHSTQSQLPPMPPTQSSAPYGDHYATNPDRDQTSPTTPAPEQRSPATQAAIEKALQPYTTVYDGRKYRLDVVQQPKRARMCGFGDKDRRPITPPPCVRLVITDAATGKELDCNEIEHTMYVLNVDLWSEDAQKEVNLVRHTTATPSISSTTPESYQRIESQPYPQLLPTGRDAGYAPSMQFGQVNQYMQPAYSQVPQYVPAANGYVPPTQYYPQHDYRQDMHAGVLPSQAPGIGGYRPPNVYNPNEMGMAQRMSIQGAAPQGMFTRNLIGSLAASAFRLTDPRNKIGIWFILQDLSVRTEGSFRLRFSFVNVGPPTKNPNGRPTNQNSIVNTGKAPVLASCFSDVFQVYSAKKFPGVCESTELSKCFAGQGIKIPIRKDGVNAKGGDDDDPLD
ncbi:Velvet complex subunit B [Pleurostoma richardsiae]|uniref:Velvet complex subunit B n=1 Tax=Pleurostoma richardsiae TaxID=41990 RepID=A0AA38RBD6_9PEZI|nr:Velvet complex subunit B [Pleurostoma richardsiae]